jgi:predicted permease
MSATLPIFIAVFIGGVSCRALGWFGKVHAERLAALVFSVSLPATILVSLDRMTWSAQAWRLPLAACLVTGLMLLSSWSIAQLLRLPRATQGGLLLGTGCINSVYFAYPVALATLGDHGLAQAILFDLGQTTLTLTVIYALALWHGVGAAEPRSMMIRFAASPPLWALGGSLTLTALSLHLPLWLRDGLIPLHLTTTPLASLVLGLSISFSVIRRCFPLALLGVAMRMGGGLFLGYVVAGLLNLDGMERAVVILVSAMPSAVTAVIFAAEAELDEDLVTSIVALSICVGVAMLPWLPKLSLLLLGEAYSK